MPRTGSPTTQTLAPRPIDIPAAPNLRDVGGHPTLDGGRVRTGLLFRSAALHRLDGDDAEAFAALGIRTVYDLRTPPEREAQPDRLPPGTSYVENDVLGDYALAGPARVTEMLRNPAVARAGLGDGQATAIWTDQYRQFVLLDHARAAYGRLFRAIADEPTRPVLFHCSTGKDRTGWAAAVFQMLLGVPDEVVMEDFLLSARNLEAFLRPVFDEFAARGGDPDLLRPILGVDPAYLHAGRTELLRCFGSVEAYFADGLGVDAALQRSLREAFVEAG